MIELQCIDGPLEGHVYDFAEMQTGDTACLPYKLSTDGAIYQCQDRQLVFVALAVQLYGGPFDGLKVEEGCPVHTIELSSDKMAVYEFSDSRLMFVGIRPNDVERIIKDAKQSGFNVKRGSDM